jgi:sulfur dioxygenase
MIFQQLFESDSSTYTYLLACPASREAILLDPVLETVERDLELLQAMNLKLIATVETHVHADHLTGAWKLKQLSGCKIAYPAMDQLACADIGLQEGTPFRFGKLELHPLFVPGHTSHHHAYLMAATSPKMLFTGDSLLIDGCGRTDFQHGDSTQLYHSIHEKLFALPGETLIYPGHDYKGRFVSTIAQEKKRNPRLGSSKTLAEFVTLMDNLDLPYPRKIDFAVPGNEICGRCPPNVPEEYRAPCEPHDQG